MPRRPAKLGGYIDEALRAGLGPRAALRQARSQGLKVQDSRWYREYGVLRQKRAMSVGIVDGPWNRAPPVNGIIRTKVRKGYLYKVKGIMRDRQSGAQKEVFATVISKRQLSRGNAVRQATAKFQDPDKRYPADLIAAFVLSVYQMVPV